MKPILNLALVACAACGWLLASPASAGVSVSGSSDDLMVDVDHAPLADVLAAIDARFPIQLQVATGLDADVSGKFQGPLRSVVARLLQSYDYIISPTQPGSREALKVIVLSGREMTETTGSIRPIKVSEPAMEQPPAPHQKRRRRRLH